MFQAPQSTPTHRIAWLAAATAVLVACGGGGDDGGGGTAPPPATSFYTDVTATHLEPGLAGGRCMDAEALDFDSDGDLDLALAIEFAPTRVLVNDGSARFTLGAVGMLANGDDHEDLAIADLDGDGDQDLAVAAEDTLVQELYLDQGAVFIGSQLAPTQVANAVVAMDVDADGDRDLIFGGTGLMVMVNDGLAGFAVEAPGRFPAASGTVQDLAAVDIDGDGDLDLALGNEGQNQLFLNQGGGAFADVTATHLPAMIDETRLMAFADIDGDLDLDLYVGNVQQEMVTGALQDFLYFNDGSGRFSASPTHEPPGAFGAYGGRFVDFDADGDPDLLLARADLVNAAQPPGFDLFQNDGTGRFVSATVGAFGGRLPEHGFGAAVGDFDGDLDLDLYLCARGAAVTGGGFVGRQDHLMLRD